MTETVNLIISDLVGHVTFLSSSMACFAKVTGAVATFILNPPILADLVKIVPKMI